MDCIRELKAGDIVTVSGTIVTARDKAYARALKEQKIPVDLREGIIYHCGPLAKREKKGIKIISAGPTTSSRMDGPEAGFIKLTGVRAIVGKGGVSEEVAEELRKLGCVYLAFTGGAGALAAKSIEKIERVVWKDLGDAEAVWVLKVKNFGPLVVAVDLHGGNLYLQK
jgi:fumarate hydratase subunit beta